MVAGAAAAGCPHDAFLVEDEEEAIDLTVGLSAEGVARKVLRATGPVVGARVVA